jgi:hypothetical protein
MARPDTLRMLLTSPEQTRYYKALDWFRTNVDKQVSARVEGYLLERVLARLPIHKNQLEALANEKPDQVPEENPDLFEEET